MTLAPKLRVFSNLAVSVDGKIAHASKPDKALGTPFDRKMMQKIRSQADCIVIGSSTMKALKAPMKINKISKKRVQPVSVVLTQSGELPSKHVFWRAKDVTRIIVTTKKGYKNAVLSAKDRAFVEIAGDSKIKIKKVVSLLSQLGHQNILVEGGGEIMAAFLKEKCLNEVYLTLTPWILGGSRNPTLVGGYPLKDWAALKLLGSFQQKNEIYLHYKVLKK